MEITALGERILGRCKLNWNKCKGSARDGAANRLGRNGTLKISEE
jgi:hypothetical protein